MKWCPKSHPTLPDFLFNSGCLDLSLNKYKYFLWAPCLVEGLGVCLLIILQIYVFLIHSLSQVECSGIGRPISFFYLFNNLGQRKWKKDIIGTRRCHQAIRLGLFLFLNWYWLECQVGHSIRFTALVSAAFTSDSQIPHTWWTLYGTTSSRSKKSWN